MKKTISRLALIIALALCLTLPAYAQNVSVDQGTSTAPVKGTYNQGSVAAEIISVDVSWGSMSFTYNDTVEGTWNDETHSFDGAVAAHWTCETDANKITIVNHSNTAVEAQLAFANAEGTNIQGAFTETIGTANDGIVSIATAVGTNPEASPMAEVYFNITGGSLSSNASDGDTIGNITLKIINK